MLLHIWPTAHRRTHWPIYNFIVPASWRHSRIKVNFNLSIRLTGKENSRNFVFSALSPMHESICSIALFFIHCTAHQLQTRARLLYFFHHCYLPKVLLIRRIYIITTSSNWHQPLMHIIVCHTLQALLAPRRYRPFSADFDVPSPSSNPYFVRCTSTRRRLAAPLLHTDLFQLSAFATSAPTALH